MSDVGEAGRGGGAGPGKDRVLVTGHALSDLDRMRDREMAAGLLHRVRDLEMVPAERLASHVARLETGDVFEIRHRGVKAFVLRKTGAEGALPVYYVMRVEENGEAGERARKVRKLMEMSAAGER